MSICFKINKVIKISSIFCVDALKFILKIAKKSVFIHRLNSSIKKTINSQIIILFRFNSSGIHSSNFLKNVNFASAI